MPLTPADLAPIRDLYMQGRYRQALQLGERHGPIRQWTGPAGRLLAGRLAIQLGAPRLGRRLHLLAYRESPAYLETVYYHARYRLEFHGPLACWEFQQAHADWSDAPPELRADWLALHALAAARLRDFDRAEKHLAAAESLVKDRPWLYVERASVLELSDRVEDALQNARTALQLHPWFRPAVQASAHLLRKLGRETEAVELLAEADMRLESGVLAAQLAGLYMDLGKHVLARDSLDRYAELSPLLEPSSRKWLAARRADVAYLLDDRANAIDLARQVGEPFYTAFARHLSGDSGQHAGEFVRTILPLERGDETLPHNLLARFWQTPMPPEPTESTTLLEGLPESADRQRYESAGWQTREFTLETAAAARLIERGVPFLITLVEGGYSQQRLVTGVDTARETIFLADGPERRVTEAPITVLVERYRAFGPRCLAVVPPGQTARLEHLVLPETKIYDQFHAVQTALSAFRFAEAAEQLERLKNEWPHHRITKQAQLAWARATAHPVKLVQAYAELLLDYPNDATLILGHAAALRDLGRNDERQSVLAAQAWKRDADPLIAQSLAQMLMIDPGQRHEALQLLRRSLRQRPTAAPGYFLMATMHWERQQFATATELYRFAACLEEREEQYVDAYARAAAATGQTPEAVRLFQKRVARGNGPAAVRALVSVLLDRDEPAQALAALDRALEKARELEPGSPRTDLAELLLLRAEMQTNAGRFEVAEADLAEARPLVPPAVWYRAAGRTARLKPDYAAALAYLSQLLALDPLSVDGHRAVVALLADTQGRPAARTYLADLIQRYPQVYSLVRLQAEFLYSDQDEAGEQAVVRLLELCPEDAWAHRQLALVLADARKDEQALSAIQTAGRLEPDHPSQFAVLAHVHRRANRIDDALIALRQGISRYPDHELTVYELVALCRGAKEKKEALQFVAERLHHGPHQGDGLLAYFEQYARLIDDPEEHERFVAELDRFLDERPDLWQSWSVAIQGRLMTGESAEATNLAQEATERFPIVARLWVDQAEAARAAGQTDERLEALRRAVMLAPGWVPIARELTEELTAAGQPAEATAVLERLVCNTPADPLAHWVLAEHLWQTDRGREALNRAKHAVRLDPGIDPRAETPWAAVLAWSDRLDCPDEAIDLARDLTRDRAGDPKAWLRLARCLTDPSQTDEALAALDTAVTLDPKNVEAHDLRAERLTALGRFDEALAAARPAVLIADLPLVLQGRAAWIEARRGNYAAAIPPMQALVAVDPEYIWGWQQLAEWYNETGRVENYLEAASELVRLRPDHPMSLTMRGEARLQAGDRDQGKGDLRDALRLHPGYSPAAVILFDACLADGEAREARAALAVLQEHLAGPEVLVKQLQYYARTGDEEHAIRTFSDLCQTPGEGPPLFVQMALSEMHTAGLADAAAEQMHKAWKSEDGFNPWVAVYWLDTPDADRAGADVRLAACEAIVKNYPQFVAGHDRRAEQLAELGRFEEAESACAPPNLVPVPVALRGRAAWLYARRGDRERAIAEMNQLVSEEPDYGWGWRQLAQWYDTANRPRDCLHAADHLVRLGPRDPVALSLRGEARRLVGDERGAADDFRKAFELDPTFEPAGLQLIAVQLAMNEVDAAADVLTRLREHASGPLVTLRSVQVASRQGDLLTARTGVRKLATDSLVPQGVLREAMAALKAAGWEAEADEELAFATADREGTPAAASLWVDRAMSAGRTEEAAERLGEIVERNRLAGREAALTYASALTTLGRASEVPAVLQRYADTLREQAEGWARAGNVLTNAGHYALAAAWLADWKDRSDLQPWMLRPLADALRALDRDAEAESVCRAATKIAAKDDVPLEFRAWLALTAAIEGRTEEAATELASCDSLGAADGVKLIFAFAQALVMVQQAGPEGKSQAFAEARDHLRTAAGACTPDELPPGASRWYRRVVARIAHDAGSTTAKLWALWQRLRPWVPSN